MTPASRFSFRRLICWVRGHKRHWLFGCAKCNPYSKAPPMDLRCGSYMPNIVPIGIEDVAASKDHDAFLELVGSRMASAHKTLRDEGLSIVLSDGTNIPTTPKATKDE